MVKQIEQEVGVIDILVNNAGIIRRVPMCEMSAADISVIIDIETNAPFIVSQAVISSMRKRKGMERLSIFVMMSELGDVKQLALMLLLRGLKKLTRNIASE